MDALYTYVLFSEVFSGWFEWSFCGKMVVLDMLRCRAPSMLILCVLLVAWNDDLHHTVDPWCDKKTNHMCFWILYKQYTAPTFYTSQGFHRKTIANHIQGSTIEHEAQAPHGLRTLYIQFVTNVMFAIPVCKYKIGNVFLQYQQTRWNKKTLIIIFRMAHQLRIGISLKYSLELVR